MLTGKNLLMTQKKASRAHFIRKGLVQCAKNRCVRAAAKHKII